jgi:hypothetical protein
MCNFAKIRNHAEQIVYRIHRTGGNQWIGIHVIIRRSIRGNQRQSAGRHPTRRPLSDQSRGAQRFNLQSVKRRARNSHCSPAWAAENPLDTTALVARRHF